MNTDAPSAAQRNGSADALLVRLSLIFNIYRCIMKKPILQRRDHNTYKMPPEVKKMVDEYVRKQNSVRELSMEELDGVSGGAGFFKQDGKWYIDMGGGATMPLDDYHDMLQDIYNEFGFDTTLEFIMLIDPNPHNEERLRTSGLDYYIGCMKNFLDNYDGSLKSKYSIQ